MPIPAGKSLLFGGDCFIIVGIKDGMGERMGRYVRRADFCQQGSLQGVA